MFFPFKMGLPTIDFHFPSKYKNNVNFEFEWNMLFAFIFFNFIYFSPSNHIKVYLPTPLTINTFVLMARSDHNASNQRETVHLKLWRGETSKHTTTRIMSEKFFNQVSCQLTHAASCIHLEQWRGRVTFTAWSRKVCNDSTFLATEHLEFLLENFKSTK